MGTGADKYNALYEEAGLPPQRSWSQIDAESQPPRNDFPASRRTGSRSALDSYTQVLSMVDNSIGIMLPRSRTTSRGTPSSS